MSSIHILRRSLLSPNVLSICSCHHFQTSSPNYLFWESDPKGGYDRNKPNLTNWQHLKAGWLGLKKELALFKDEFKEKIEMDPILVYQPGVIDKKWELRSQKSLDEWTSTCDSDNGEGFSSCSLTINSRGYGHFSGILDTMVPKDGIIKRAGYCSIRTIRARKSFQRDSYMDWCPYTHIVLRVRGDGRSYMLNIANSGYFDQLWNDMYHYVLYTRGGPYWQITKIPFSKFFFANKGRIQDTQTPIQLDKVTHFGITAADKVNGPFSLEIDYIGLEYDPTHTEESAYEMYQVEKNIAGH